MVIKLKEMEKKYDETRDILEELIYHFILEMEESKNIDQEHTYILRNEIENLFKNRMVFEDEISQKIKALTTKESEEMIKEVMDLNFKKNIEEIESLNNREKELKKIIKNLQDDNNLEIFGNDMFSKYELYDVLDGKSSSEKLWKIFDKVKEIKEQKKSQLKEEILKPYLEKYEEIKQINEEQ